MTTATLTPELTLRDYQNEALDRIGAAEARGVRRQLGVAATGLGKTIIFCALARRKGVRTLVLAHRDELIEQAAAKVQEVWPGVSVGVVKAERNEVHADVVVASVQTLARPARLASLLAPTLTSVPFGLVVVDEAHHSAAASYRILLDALHCGEADGPLLLGVTATPDRGDGKGLDDLFDEITFTYDLRWGIARGYLSDLRGLRVQLSQSMADVKVSRGDYEAGSAGRWLEDCHAPEAIVRSWLAHAAGRRTLVFTPTVATAEAVADEFVRRGVAAAHVDGAMDLETRRARLQLYADGVLDVLANCQVLTEGYDEPRTDCIVVARPTKSRALYTQMVGRGTRRHPEKLHDCLVIDVVGASDVHDLVCIPSLFGIEKPERMYADGLPATEVLHEQIEHHTAVGRLVASEAALFDKVRSKQRMAWVAVHAPGEPKRFHLSLGRSKAYVVMVERPSGHWRAGFCDSDGNKRVLMDEVSMELAQGVGEDVARKLGDPTLTNTDAKWRAARPTRKQLELAKKMKIDVPAGATKGDVSDLLTAKMGRPKKSRT